MRRIILGFALLLAVSGVGCAVRRVDTPSPATPAEGLDDRGRFVLVSDRRTTVFEGNVRVRFLSPVSTSRGRSLLERNGLEVIGWDPHTDVWVARTVSSLSSVLALENRLWPTRVEIDPILMDLPGPVQDPAGPNSGFHRVPRECRELGVVLETSDPSLFERKVLDVGGDPVGIVGAMRTIRFPSSAAMESAQTQLRDLDGVRRIGPLISRSPEIILTNQLIVRMDGTIDPRTIDLGSLGLEYVRPLPYLANGHLLAWEGPVQGDPFAPSCGIYDVAASLLRDSRVKSAIPNLIAENRAACSGTSCTIDSHQGYLSEINVCGAWQTVESGGGSSSDDPVVVGVLDYGAYDETACADLDAAMVIDFETMQHCVPDPDDSDDWCTDCDSVVGGWTGNSHGTQAALTIAADCDGPDSGGVAPARLIANARVLGGPFMSDVELADALWWLAGGDPQWVCDPGASDYFVNYCESGSSITAASDLPCPLGESSTATGSSCVASAFDSSSYKADILNMSFTREDFLSTLDDCRLSAATSSVAPICNIVCTDTGACGILEEVLQRLRNPQSGDGVREEGVAVVAAQGIDATRYENVSGVTVSRSQNSLCFDTAGNPASDVYRTHEEWNRHTDLAASTATIAAGSVTSPASGSHPFTDDGSDHCLIQFRGESVDVVAPMGGEGSYQTLCHDCADCGGTPCDHTFGESSAATAIVSGVAALMLEANPSLTADQIHCILRSTADPLNDTGEAWEKPQDWQVPGCGWNDFLHSDCVGYGMVDAYTAVQAAVACIDATDPGCLWAADVDPADTAACVQGFSVAPEKETEGTGGYGPFLIVEVEPMCCMEFPDWVIERILCPLGGNCRCRLPAPAVPGDTESCVAIDYVSDGFSASRTSFRQVEFKVCVGETCRTVKELARWNPSKDRVRIMIPSDARMASMIRTGRREGQVPMLYVFAQGRRLTHRELPGK